MPSSPLGSTHGRTTLGMACHHRLWAAQTIERRRAWHAIITFGLAHTVGRLRAWHAIIALGRETRSNDVERDMPSSRLGSTHDQTKSDVTCHQRPWIVHTVEQRHAWHDITALRLHERSDNVGRGMTSPPLTAHSVGNVRRGMTSPPLDSTHGRQRRAWHAITAVGHHTRSTTSGAA